MNKSIFLKKMGIISLFFILFLNVVSAVPPQSVQQFTEGYILKYPEIDTLKEGEDFEFEIHVFNISDGTPVISGISCNFHLYEGDGTHRLELKDSTPSHTYDYSFNVAGGNFTTDIIGYVINCNSSTLGGYHSQGLTVTRDGSLLDEFHITQSVWFFVILAAFSLGMMILGFAIRDPIITLIGSFVLFLLGLFVIINGVVGIKNTTTTWAIGIATLGIAFYVSIRTAYELLDGN